jgi:four helix bundle protein
MHDFRQLDVWNRSLSVAEEVYEITRTFPGAEQFGLTAQMRRAAVSIVSNIAEGSSRATQRDVRRFLSISRGSASELETQAILAERLGFLPSEAAKRLYREIDGVRAMLIGLANNLAESYEA